MKLQLIRHATIWLQYAGVQFLIDPMFSEKGAFPPVENTPNQQPNPLVQLPASPEKWARPDYALVTHLHPDHWDTAAAAALDHTTPILCQPGDEAALKSAGFESVTEIDASTTFGKITITRTSGQHGTGEIGDMMGRVSGFVFKAEGEPTLYIAGDTIWCDDVRQTLDEHRPDVTVVNAGAAQFLVGGPITMDADDVIRVCEQAPYTKVVAVHMEAFNHCLLTRADLQNRLKAEGVLAQVTIPADGEWL